MPHDWIPNPGTDPMHEASMGLQTTKCKKCGCIRIAKLDSGKYEYKPMEWTWNPFKTLKSEPPCPARW